MRMILWSGPLLFILYTSELFHIIVNHIVGYADDTMIYAFMPRLFSRLQVMEMQNEDLVAVNSWCLQWHMGLNPKKTKSMLVIRSRTNDLTLGGAELEKLKRLRILGVTLDSKLTFDTHLQEVVLKAARSLVVVRQVGKLFDCPHMLKSCFNAYVLSSLEYWAHVWISSAESHLVFLDSIVRNAERLCECKRRCLGHRRKCQCLVFALNNYHWVDHSIKEYLNHFVVARNTRASAALGELALLIPLCRTDHD